MKPTYTLEVYLSKTKKLWFWRLRSKRNKKIVSDGAEGYFSKGNAERAVKKLPFDWGRVLLKP